MAKHNNQTFNSHFRKHWIRNVKTWFDQPANKLRRRINRQNKVSICDFDAVLAFSFANIISASL